LTEKPKCDADTQAIYSLHYTSLTANCTKKLAQVARSKYTNDLK